MPLPEVRSLQVLLTSLVAIFPLATASSGRGLNVDCWTTVAVSQPETVQYTAELRYDESKQALVVVYKNDKGEKLDTLHVAPGDKVTISVTDPGNAHSLGTWKAYFKWEEKQGKDKVPMERWVKLPKKGSLDSGVVLKAQLKPSVPVNGDEEKRLQHQFTKSQPTKELGLMNQPCELVIAGVIDLHKPDNSEFRKPHRSAKITAGPIREDGSEGQPKAGVWYTVQIKIERIQDPPNSDLP